MAALFCTRRAPARGAAASCASSQCSSCRSAGSSSPTPSSRDTHLLGSRTAPTVNIALLRSTFLGSPGAPPVLPSPMEACVRRGAAAVRRRRRPELRRRRRRALHRRRRAPAAAWRGLRGAGGGGRRRSARGWFRRAGAHAVPGRRWWRWWRRCVVDAMSAALQRGDAASGRLAAAGRRPDLARQPPRVRLALQLTEAARDEQHLSRGVDAMMRPAARPGTSASPRAAATRRWRPAGGQAELRGARRLWQGLRHGECLKAELLRRG